MLWLRQPLPFILSGEAGDYFLYTNKLPQSRKLFPLQSAGLIKDVPQVENGVGVRPKMITLPVMRSGY
jgi:hypothetical protein